MVPDFIPGDVLLLEREIPGIPYETGIFVLCAMTRGAALVALVNNDAQGLYAIDNRYVISREDFGVFTPLGKRARIRK